MEPLVTIIIPAYNCERYIGETLESVRKQTFQNFEVLVVDDGSTDNQRAVIESFVKVDDRIKYIFQKNQGVSAARNNGFARSSGQYIAFLDSDDIWHSDNLEHKVSALRESDAGLVHSDALIINENSEIIDGFLSGISGRVLEPLLLWDGTQIPGPSSILVKREVVEVVGGFDENLSTSADKDFFFRVAAQYPIAKVPLTTWRYRKHVNNMHKNIKLMEHDIIYLYQKASRLNLFQSESFKARCYAAMYLILSASWAGDGKNWRKGVWYLLLAIRCNPAVVIKKLLSRWR
jgi:glycosyltransferase involved in cell wall biosynthesis